MAMTPKVLVVNDDSSSLLALTSLLARWEKEIVFETVSARSGEDALRRVLRDDFAVILLDVSMPGMDGFETAQMIHSRPLSAHTPIIFITAHRADEIYRLKGYEKGAVDYLFTPIIPEILKAKIATFVSLAQANLRLKAQATVLEARARQLTQMNESLAEEIEGRRIAEKRNKATEEFLAMLGHELRNPLSAISGAASVLGIGTVGEEKAATANRIILRQVGQLTRIVDDLLDLSRVMSGKIALDKRVQDVSALVHACVETLAQAGRTQQHLFSIMAAPVMVEVDAVRMTQVITNLLDNALKYTPPGGRIDVDVEATGDTLVLRVRDSGVGIPRELLPRIFDVFVQGTQTLDRTKSGMGIGLALVRQLVLLHGGSVNAHSDPAGGGSMFEVCLPRSIAPDAPPADAYRERTHDRAHDRAAQAHRILVIDDNDDGRESLAMLLAASGHHVLKAHDGKTGIGMATAEGPDIAIVDIGLPGIDGYEVARQMRADPAMRRIGLIACTGYGLESDRAKALEAGFDVHLVKPITPELLGKAIANCGGGRGLISRPQAAI